ncbi:MAG TPA: ABC transporter ATP-binding protein [Planctomycetes bacterium]|nr:ABC transporter ATP-binding protein [Planctomycetota bacterium]
MSASAVQVEGLVKKYGEAAVLDIDFCEFEAGGIHVVTGPNGAGKTTLLRIINGIEAPNSGSVRIFGTERRALSKRAGLDMQREMALAAQKPYLFNASVRRNVEYPLRVRGAGEGECARRADAAMDALGVLHLADRDAHTLSAGEAQRVSLARAIVSEPRLLLLDEPLGGIAADGVPLVENAIEAQRARGATVIMATHVPEHAYRFSGSVVRLAAGKIVPLAAENYFEGEVVDEASCPVFVFGDGVRMSVVTEKRGRARAVIHPEEIIVSLEAFASSARNVFEGRITSVKETGGAVHVLVDAGFPIATVITAASKERLGLSAGSAVFLTFKASSVKVF